MKRSIRRWILKNIKKRATKLGEAFSCLYDNLANCSCPICGNPRKYGKGKEKYTIQELKHEQNLQRKDLV